MEPKRPAEQVVPVRLVELLRRARKRSVGEGWTVGRFFRESAMLGGFLGRTGTANPAGSRFGVAGRNCIGCSAGPN